MIRLQSPSEERAPLASDQGLALCVRRAPRRETRSQRNQPNEEELAGRGGDRGKHGEEDKEPLEEFRIARSTARGKQWVPLTLFLKLCGTDVCY